MNRQRSSATSRRPKKVPGDLTVDLDDLREMLVNLRQNGDMEFQHLTPAVNQQLRQVGELATVLRGTDQYNVFVDTVREVFSGTPVKIGTAGAYVAGCILNSDDPDVVCSPICVGSIPGEDNDSWIPCNHYVITAKEDNGSYFFMEHNYQGTVVDTTRADIYLQCNGKTFQGFSEAEKDKLKSSGIQLVHIACYDGNNSETQDITDGYVPIDSLPVRLVVSKTSHNYNNVIWIILLILAVLVMMFLLTRWASRT